MDLFDAQEFPQWLVSTDHIPRGKKREIMIVWLTCVADQLSSGPMLP